MLQSQINGQATEHIQPHERNYTIKVKQPSLSSSARWLPKLKKTVLQNKDQTQKTGIQ